MLLIKFTQAAKIQHLDALDDLREGIGLRAAGQRDPLVEYKKEAFALFEKLITSIDYEIVHRIFKVQVRQEPTIERIEEKGIEVHPESHLARPNGETAKSPSSPTQVPAGPEKDPTEMTDEELNAEIARLEALEKSAQSEVHSSQEVVNNSLNTVNRQPLTANQPLRVTKIGRNDPCPCGAVDPNTGRPYKYKKCGLINASHHRG